MKCVEVRPMNHPILLLIVACGLVAAVWSGCGGVDAPETEAYQCIPQCEGKQCGDDGCGGTCGECEAGYECVTMSCTFEGGYCFSYEVYCPVYCEGQGAECGEVNTANAEGSPVCDCGTCPPGQACINNETMDELGGQHCCTPSCTAKECGDDGCGGVCGDCPPDQPCVYGYCCVPYCGQENEAECGDDGCGGSCGECAPGEVCGEADYDAIGVCFDMVKDCAEICLVQKPTGTCGPVWTGLRSPEDCECGCPGVQDECIDYK